MRNPFKKRPKISPEEQERIKILDSIKKELCDEVDQLIIDVKHWEKCFPSSVGAYQGSEYLHRYINDEDIKNSLINKIDSIFV